jgi:hypothetical protein
MNEQTDVCCACVTRREHPQVCAYTRANFTIVPHKQHSPYEQGGGVLALDHVYLMGQAGQLQCTPLGPEPEFVSCAKNGVEDKKFIFSKSSSCMGSGRRGVVRASAHPRPTTTTASHLHVTVRVGHALQQHAIKGGEEAHLQWFCAHMFNVMVTVAKRTLPLTATQHTSLCSSSTSNTHSNHTPRAWPAQQHTQRSRTKPTCSHARNHLFIAHTVGGRDRSCVRGEKKKCC